MPTDSTLIPPQKPKRFLTAYNFFFMHERSIFLNSEPNGEGEENKLSEAGSTLPTASTIANANKPAGSRARRKHTKGHGKIKFAELSRLVSRKWKALSPEEKKVFDDLAAADLERFRDENWEYKRQMRKIKRLEKKQQQANELLAAQGIEKDKETTTHPDSATEKTIQNQDVTQPQVQRYPIEASKSTPKDTSQLTHPTNQSINSLEYRPTCYPQQPYANIKHKYEQHNGHSRPDTSKENEGVTRYEDNFPKPVKPSNLTLQPALPETKEGETSKKKPKNNNALIGNSDCKPKNINEEEDELDDFTIDSDGLDTFTMESFALMSIDPMSIDQGNNFTKVVYEGVSTRLLCASDSTHKFNGHTGFVGIKLLVDQFPKAERISQLENEYKVSQYLSNCSSTRRTFEFTKHEGLYAICFEWAEGITLKQWIRSFYKEREKDTLCQQSNNDGVRDTAGCRLLSAVRLALKVSEALAELHGSGVVHNNITSDNIIVEEKANDNSFSVKLIDLGLATVFDKDDDISTKTQVDLCSLGSIFFELFTGVNLYCSKYSAFDLNIDAPEDIEQERSAQRGDKHEQYISLRSRVPLCLSTMIYSLVEKRGEHGYYHSASEVIEELLIMLNNSEFFLLDMNTEKIKYPFHFQTTKLYGRAQYTMILMSAFDRVSQPTGSSEVVMISGYSGAGKSALVQQVREPMIHKGGNFLCGKFDIVCQMAPLSAITSAFTDFCNELASRDAHELHEMTTAIQEVVGSEISVLTTLIPSLSRITGASKSPPIEVGCMEAQNRLKHTFQLFVRAITTPTRPFVLFLDDLQWADSMSLELIESLITDIENTSLLLIGAYRDNEVSDKHPLAVLNRKLETKSTPITKIKVGDLSKQDTNELISDRIHTPSDLTLSLADVVYRKTGGNVFFILQFLRSLCDEYLVFFSLRSKQWQWDTRLIETKKLADNAVGLISHKILQFPKMVQNVLKLIACLGSFCEKSNLRLVVARDGMAKWSATCNSNLHETLCFQHTDLVSSLDFAVEEGVMDYIDSKYKFAHDQIQNASYSLIPENESGYWHLWIGNQVWANRALSPNKALFIAVGQLNKGKMLIHDFSQRIELAQLNLEAARNSISLAAFEPAAFYSKMGISLLDNNCWANHYELCLHLYDACADAEYCRSNFEEMREALDTTFANARHFDDKLCAYVTLTNALGAQGKLQEAVKTGLFVVSQLDEPTPSSIDMRSIISLEFMRTKAMLDERTENDILTMNAMVDGQKITAMRFMSTLLMFSYFGKCKEYVVFLTSRMVKITLCYGLCNASSFAFAFYGFLLSSIFSDMSGAYNFGKLALILLDRSESKECLARVYTVVYGITNPWGAHHHSSIEPLKNGYKVGMQYGDIQFALLSCGQYLTHSYNCGVELGTMEKRIREYGQLFYQHKQETCRKALLIYRQTALNLMGRSRDPLQLSGDAMDQDIFLREAIDDKQWTLVGLTYHHRGWLAYLFGDFELASKMIEESELVLEGTVSAYVFCNHTFLDGLVSYALYNNTNQAEWIQRARSATEKMKNYAQYSPSNYQNKLLLLEAESAFLLGESDHAAKLYDAAIKASGDNGFVQEQAIAYERAGLFHLKQDNNSMASYCYGEAHSAYLRWEAQGKANHLRERFPF